MTPRSLVPVYGGTAPFYGRIATVYARNAAIYGRTAIENGGDVAKNRRGSKEAMQSLVAASLTCTAQFLRFLEACCQLCRQDTTIFAGHCRGNTASYGGSAAVYGGDADMNGGRAADHAAVGGANGAVAIAARFDRVRVAPLSKKKKLYKSLS